MQVGSPNSAPASANPASSQTASESGGSRAEQFARVLKSAFFGVNTKATSQGTERAAPEAAQRQDARPAADAPRNTNTRDASTSAPAPRETSPRNAEPAQKPRDASNTVPKDATAEQPAAEEPAKTSDTEGLSGEQAAAQPTDGLPATDAPAQPAPPTTVVETAPDASVILALLQGEAPQAPMPVGETVVAPVVAEDAAALPMTDSPETALPTTLSALPALPTGAEKAVAATAQIPAPPAPAMPVETPAAVQVPVAQVAPAPASPDAVLPHTAAEMAKATATPTTSTSAAALLVEQDAVTAEDFAAIQQALLAQQQKPAGQPAVDNTTKAEGKLDDGKTVSVQVQTVAPPAASKTLVDQSALLAMQGDEMPQDAASLPAQLSPQSQASQAQPDMKFAATLQASATGDAALPQGQTAAHSPAHLTQQAAAPLTNPGTPAPQAAQHATMQIAARQLGQHIPAGEQVAVQIKRGVADGHDKISIRLDPGNLGKVEVKMEVGHDGRLMAVVAADKPETLAMLQKDAANLEQALRDAGLKTDAGSLSFTLRDQNQAGDGRGGRDGQMAGHGHGAGQDDYAEGNLRSDPAQLAAANAQRAAAARGGLDIRI